MYVYVYVCVCMYVCIRKCVSLSMRTRVYNGITRTRTNYIRHTSKQNNKAKNRKNDKYEHDVSVCVHVRCVCLLICILRI